MKKPFIAGNWKLHKTIPEAVELAGELAAALADTSAADLLVCPPFPALKPVADVLEGSGIAVGAQDIFYENSGAWTGTVSGPMLTAAGCSYVIIGHSERRQHFHDTGEVVNRKLNAAFNAGLIPIVCIGEPLEKRQQNVTREFLKKQIDESFAGISAEQLENLLVAYEPIWAIGTGRTATPEIAEDTQSYIRELFRDRYGSSTTDGLRILYGGSVKPENAASLFAQEDIDGFLVGGASLKADSFAGIVAASISG